MAQQEYEQSQAIDAPPEEVFAWLSDVGNLPKYLPPVVDSRVEGPSAEGVPGQRIRASLEYPGEGGGTFDAEGYLSVNEVERRMEWGAEAGRDYSGWLAVGNHGEGGSEVVVHLSFGERSAGPEIEERAPEGRDPLAEGVSATLESIRRQIEEGSGKVEAPPPPEGAEPQLDENPAVVDEDPLRVRRATDATSAVLTEARGSKRSAKPGFTVLVRTSASADRREGNERLAPCRTGLLSAP
jgi:uncharacterized protein YndB with AHSA1/START domain